MLDLFALQAWMIGMMRAANVVAAAAKWAPENRVWDDAPQNVTTADGAYLDIAGKLDVLDDATLSDGVEHWITLNVWSEHKGFKEVTQVAGRIRACLHRQTFDVGDMHAIIWLDGVTYLTAADGVTRQAVIRLRCACRT
jgi:hypothetical protein